jgi:hypothetical protein
MGLMGTDMAAEETQSPAVAADMGDERDTPAGGDQSTGELVKQATLQVSELVRQEIRLAMAETREKGREAGLGAGLFGVAGIVALYGGGAITVAVGAALALAMPVWAAALIVGVALPAVAGVAALLGRRHVAKAVPPVPEEALAGVRTDAKTIKERIHR